MSNEKIKYLNPNSLHPFENNPFQSVDENEYNELRDSVMEFGIITPSINRITIMKLSPVTGDGGFSQDLTFMLESL